jgi:hypothetical protein
MKVVLGVVALIGFDSCADDLSSDSKGLCDKTCECLVASTSRAQTLLVACMSARTEWMLAPEIRGLYATHSFHGHPLGLGVD